jgi:hypothetical protein
MADRRAGGFIDRGDGKGWVLDESPPAPSPKEVPHKPLSEGSQIKQTGGWALIPESVPEPEPEAESDDDYDDWSVEDLKAEVSAREIEGRSQLTTKAELIKALKKNDKEA